MFLSSDIWGPKFWFFLQTVAMTYPEQPDARSKKKYYDFIQNLPVFLPDKPMGTYFIKLLDDFPVTPYLSSGMSFMKWVHFINNKLNKAIDEPEIDFYESLEKYYEEYKPKEIRNKEMINTRKKYIQFVSALLIIFGIIYFYKK